MSHCDAMLPIEPNSPDDFLSSKQNKKKTKINKEFDL